jgi:hypothetical protein
MALFGSGMAYGQSHGNANLPLVLAGGSAMGLKHGSHLDFNQGHFDGYQLDNPKAIHYAGQQPPREPGRPHEQPAADDGPAHGSRDDQFGDSNKVISL